MLSYSDDFSFEAIVDFTKTVLVSIDLLDLSVISSSGNCKLDLTQEIVIPNHLTSGWQIRLKKVISKYKEYQKQLEELKPHLSNVKDDAVREMLWQSTMPKAWTIDFGISESPYIDGIFDFGLQRVERYRQPGAVSLLKKYSQYLSRDADEFDFTKLVDEIHRKK